VHRPCRIGRGKPNIVAKLGSAWSGAMRGGFARVAWREGRGNRLPDGRGLYTGARKGACLSGGRDSRLPARGRRKATGR
jgi:hypothetical protein